VAEYLAHKINSTPTMTINLIGLSGSLRKDSYNTALLHAAAALMPEGSTLTVRTIHGIPLYNGDEEDANGVPPLVDELKTSIAHADGLLLCTPEYNHSIPGPFKNAIDWLSRPDDDISRVFGDKPVVVIGASPGGFGTILAQNAWLPVLNTLGTRPWFGDRLFLSRAHQAFAADGQLTDAATRDHLRALVTAFVHFVARQKMPGVAGR
jgi:NAD(P)H-dependent FMN reductase